VEFNEQDAKYEWYIHYLEMLCDGGSVG
jgi:hypothetical protein